MKKTLSEINHDKLYEAKKTDLFAVPGFKTVYDLYREYTAAGNYPYLSAVADYIEKKLGLDLNATEKRNLESFAYYVSRQIDEERKTDYAKKMLAAGWLALSTEIVKQAYEHGRKVMLVYESQSILGITGRVEKTLKPVIAIDGSAWLMKPRARKKGYPATGFQNAFCKIV